MGVYLFDQYSLLHFASGVVAYFLGLSLGLWFAAHVVFEIVENTEEGIRFINKYLWWVWPGGKDVADAGINQIGDVISGLVGWLMAYMVDEIGKKKGWYRRDPKFGAETLKR